jgi:hypothetical protein
MTPLFTLFESSTLVETARSIATKSFDTSAVVPFRDHTISLAALAAVEKYRLIFC